MNKPLKIIFWGLFFLPICFAAILSIMYFVFLKMHTPDHEFGEIPIPEAPDYALRSNWAGWPGPNSPADRLPSNLSAVPYHSRPAAAFFLHPTTFGSNENYVQSMDDLEVKARTDSLSVATQASVFNHCCVVFAPRYRQTGANYSEGDVGIRIFEIGYTDIRTAFFYFLNEIGDETPFILAGHSQGSFHLARLVMEEISETPLVDRLIAVYAIGHQLPIALVDKGLPDIDICERPLQFGCFISWDSHRGDKTPIQSMEGFDEPLWNGVDYSGYKNNNQICVNPITWKTDHEPSKREDHLGAIVTLKRKSSVGDELPDLIENDVSAYCRTHHSSNWLMVNAERVEQLKDNGIFSYFERNTHGYDYDYFWANIRQNARDRTDEFFAKKNTE
jgi:hypothetical protein